MTSAGVARILIVDDEDSVRDEIALPLDLAAELRDLAGERVPAVQDALDRTRQTLRPGR